MGQRGQLVLPDRKGHRVLKVQPVLMVQMGRRGLSALPEHKGQQDPVAQPEHKVFRD